MRICIRDLRPLHFESASVGLRMAAARGRLTRARGRGASALRASLRLPRGLAHACVRAGR